MTEHTTAATPAPGEATGRSRRWLGIGVSVLVLVVSVLVLRGRWDDVVAAGGLPGPGPLVAATLANVIGNALLTDAWRTAVRLAGSPLRWAVAARIWSTSQLSRLLFPGATVGARAVLAKDHGVPTTVGLATSALEIVWMLSLTPILALATLPWWVGPASGLRWVGLIAVAPASLLVAVVAVPDATLTRLAALAAHVPGLRSRAPRIAEAAATGVVDRRIVLHLLGRYVANVVTRLIAFIVLLAAIAGVDTDLLLRAVGAFGLGRFVGAVTPFAPGGIGPREGVTAAVLGPAIGGSAALALVAVVRLVELVAEGLFLVGARVAARSVTEPA